MKQFDSELGKHSFLKLEGEFASTSLRVFLAGPYLGADAEEQAPSSIRHDLYIHLKTKTNHDVALGEHDSISKSARKFFKRNGFIAASELDCARLADAIIVDASNIGAFCELGAWSTQEDLCSKMLIFADKKFEKEKSYFRIGTLSMAESHGAIVRWIDFTKMDSARRPAIQFLKARKEKVIVKKVIEGGGRR